MKQRSHYFGKTWDHIDPLYGEKDHGFSLVCGLHCLANLCELWHSSNIKKSDAFVPYRVCNHLAPQSPGDVCEFWIDGGWMVTEFLGYDWWREARELGYSKSNAGRRLPTDGSSTRGTTWMNDGERNYRVSKNQIIPSHYKPGMIKNV